jgi:hypothetical protein
MATSVPSFLNLYYLLWDYQKRAEHAHVYQDILLPWQTQALEAIDVLRVYGNIEARHWRPGLPDPCNGGDRGFSCLHRLYALSRISDLLILPLQTAWDFLRPPVLHWTPERVERYFSWMRGVGIPQVAPSISLEERNAWLSSLGLEEFHQPAFHPFYHEIVEVEQTPNPDEPITLTGMVWSGFMLGQMMLCRAGVRVRGGEHIVRKDLAEHSHLYWAFARYNRPVEDLSIGWGSNSQWATDFRRDYVDEQAYYYNVDGDIDIHASGYYRDLDGDIDTEGDSEQPYLEVPDRIQLLTHRCFIVTPERRHEEYLWDVTYREAK